MTLLGLLAELNPDALTMDGFDGALVGIDQKTMSAVYSTEKCIEILVNQGMTHEEAQDYYEFNVLGSYMGEYTPIHIITK